MTAKFRRKKPGSNFGHLALRLGKGTLVIDDEEIWLAIHLFERDRNVFMWKGRRLESMEDAPSGRRSNMRDFKNNSRSLTNRRDLWSRDKTPPQGASRDTESTHASNSTESSVKMALTCKVQYLDDTDPFASTNFPEPTRPPTYTFHLNIPLFQQIAGLHRLLSAPHSVCRSFCLVIALQLSLEYFVVLLVVCVQFIFINCDNVFV